MSNFTFFYNVFFAVFYLKIPFAIFTLKSCNSHISVIICSFFEFRMVSKWCIREWFKSPFSRARSILTHHALDTVTDEQTSKNTQKPNFEHLNTFPYEPVVFMCLQYQSFENIVGKGEIFPKEQFLLCPHCFHHPFGKISTNSSNRQLSPSISFSFKSQIV